MKKIVVSILMLVIGIQSFSQPTLSTQTSLRQLYLATSKQQKTTAWVLLGVSAAVITTGRILISTADTERSSGIIDKKVAGRIISDFGILITLVSAPLFMTSAHNKSKAMKLSTGIDMQGGLLPAQGGFVFRSVPALSLRFSF